jgi:hypothetical protein
MTRRLKLLSQFHHSSLDGTQELLAFDSVLLSFYHSTLDGEVRYNDLQAR